MEKDKCDKKYTCGCHEEKECACGCKDSECTCDENCVCGCRNGGCTCDENCACGCKKKQNERGKNEENVDQR